MKNILIFLIPMMMFVSCQDLASKKILFGTWKTTIENSNEYEAKVLKIGQPTDELKADKEGKWAGIFKQAYISKSVIVTDSIEEGKWKYGSMYDSKKGGFVNSFELHPNIENAIPTTREFYFDGSALLCIDRSGDSNKVENYYKLEQELTDF